MYKHFFLTREQLCFWLCFGVLDEEITSVDGEKKGEDEGTEKTDSEKGTTEQENEEVKFSVLLV